MFPQAVVVVQEILPFTTLPHGELDSFWTSIQTINSALKEFCRTTDRLMFSPAADFFLEPIHRGNISRASEYRIDLTMVDELGFPSLKGWKFLGKSIVNDCSATPDVVVDCAEFRCMVGGQWSCYQAP